MEPRQIEKSVESRGEGQASPTRHPERKRRFQIIKLEERIAPGGGHGNGSNAGCGGGGGHTAGPHCRTGS
jgi:hypothetical protein